MDDLIKNVSVFLMMLLFSVLLAIILGIIFYSEGGNVAQINIYNEISSSSSVFSGSISSEDIINLIKKADSDPNIKALLISINSPGGTFVSSKEVVLSLKAVKKPKICWMHDIATSGAYWVATACDVIVADEFTLTGSIGVTGSYLEYSKLFEKYGITYVRLVSGEKKDIGSPYKNITSSEREDLQKLIDEMHNYFVESVANNRNLSKDFVLSIADGNFMTGKEAYNLKLIDYLGDKELVYNLTQKYANLTDIKVVVYETKFNWYDLFLGTISKAIENKLSNNNFLIKV